jgi:lipoprotein-releasing system permease protein
MKEKISLLLTLAKRYLFSKKKFAVINIISIISVIGVAVGTMALFVVLSVFNGFEKVIVSLFNDFHSDFKIESVSGKTLDFEEFPVDDIDQIDGVISIVKVIEDIALARYDNRQYIVTLKAVSDNFLDLQSLNQIIVYGEPELYRDNMPCAIVGGGLHYALGINLNDITKSIGLYAPKRIGKVSVSLSNIFNSVSVLPSAMFSVQQEFDEKFIIIPLDIAKQLYEYSTELTAVEVYIKADANEKLIERQLGQILGDSFSIKNRYKQQEMIYKILRSEKLAIFIILIFILIVATFNVLGTLSLTILEKRQDIAVLSALGAPMQFLRALFIVEGYAIVMLGAIIGLFAGGVLSYLQQRYGLLGLGTEGDFVISAYPVHVKISDVFYILLSVSLIGLITAWIPTKKISGAFLQMRENVALNDE